MTGGWPRGLVVEFVHSTSTARGSRVWIMGMDLHTAHEAMLWRRPSYKVEEDWHRCSLSNNLPQWKEEDWQQTLAQGRSSFQKKKKLPITWSYPYNSDLIGVRSVLGVGAFKTPCDSDVPWRLRTTALDNCLKSFLLWLCLNRSCKHLPLNVCNLSPTCFPSRDP